MLKTITITIALIGLSCAVPALAQNQDEEGKVNFSMGGGFTVPMNPIARFAGHGGSFLASGGPNLDQHNSILVQFMWNGLPPSKGALAPSEGTQLNGISKSVNLYSLTADYKYRARFGKMFGAYVIIGGGLYYRYSNLSTSVLVNTPTVCQPVYVYDGFTCSDGYVNAVGMTAGTGSFGANGGIGLTFNIHKGWKFFMESRYIYAWSRTIATPVVPVVFGVEFQ
jgi:hypothetical protein